MNVVLKRLLYIVIGIVILGLIVWPKLKKEGGKTPQSQVAKSGTGATVKVEGIVIKTSDFENFYQATGNLIANEEVQLKSEVSGLVKKIYFKEGANVGNGQLLVKLIDDDLKAELQKNGANLALARGEEARYKKLLEKEGISKAEYEAIDNQLKVLQAEYDITRSKIRKTEITAPFAGKIGLKYISEGGFVTSSSVIASLQDLSRIKVEFSVPAKLASKVSIDKKVEFTVEGYPDIFTSKVYAIEPHIEEATRTIKIRAIATNTSRNLIPGAFANVRLLINYEKNTVFIPTLAVIPDFNAYKVFVKKNGVAKDTLVVIGERDEKNVQIVKGLAIGDTLLTTGLLQLKRGSKVIVKINK